LDSNIARKRMQKKYSLTKLLELPATERKSLGVAHTLHEILQQPQTWVHTFEKIVRREKAIETFLLGAGIGVDANTPLNVFLVGAGTSDYIGKSVGAPLRKEWRCDVGGVSRTDLPTNTGGL